MSLVTIFSVVGVFDTGLVPAFFVVPGEPAEGADGGVDDDSLPLGDATQGHGLPEHGVGFRAWDEMGAREPVVEHGGFGGFAEGRENVPEQARDAGEVGLEIRGHGELPVPATAS